MQAKATHKYIRIAPRKVRLVADLIKGKRVVEAEQILRVVTRGAAEPLAKVLHSAVASAKNTFELDEHNLYVAKLAVDEGPKLKRYRPRARGRAYPIQKKTSHVMLVLDEIEPTKSKKGQKKGSRDVSAAPQASVEVSEKTKQISENQQKRKAGKETTSLREVSRTEIKPKTEGRAKRIFRRKAI